MAGAQTLLFVSEYGTGNLRAYNYATGTSESLPSGYTPVAGVSTGSDGMVLGDDGRLFVNRGDGTISRRSADGNSFSTFATISGASDLLDLTRNTTHLFAARFSFNNIYSVSLANAAVNSIAGPSGAARFDGVRIGPDGRLYANNFNDGEVWRSNIGITSMESSAFVTGLDQPGSMYFAVVPEPAAGLLLVLGGLALLGRRRFVRNNRFTREVRASGHNAGD